MKRITEQEEFWEGKFGDDYAERNRGANWVASNAALFSKVFARTGKLKSVLELGSNIGLNLLAIRQLLPEARLSAVEINMKAAEELKRGIPDADVRLGSIFDFSAEGETWDLVFTKGVLIHINPDMLPCVYEIMHRHSARFLMVAEYYNPKPVEVPYRGETGKLFKRDFAGELMDKFPGLSLVDYGFVYHRDPAFPQDDATWFLLEKPRA